MRVDGPVQHRDGHIPAAGEAGLRARRHSEEDLAGHVIKSIV